jgi:hypothetical protein
MPKYIVINPIKSGGQRHMPGAEVEIDAKTAKALLDSGDIKASTRTAKEPEPNTSESEAKAAGDQEEKAEGAGAPAAAGTAAQPAGKKKGAQ